MSDPRDEHDNPEIDCKECEGTGWIGLEMCPYCYGYGKRPMTDDELETFKNNQKYNNHEKL